jgi:uncharacterized membrane protein YeaQ/YmgE (transglycosylase-associated protein family)
MFYLIWVILLGIAAGWIAGKIMKGSGFGLLGNLIVGILGSLLGNFVFGLIGLSAYRLPARLIMAVVGSVILLWLLRFIKKS